jgi:Mn-dependent DtxR family transcriptional regulator
MISIFCDQKLDAFSVLCVQMFPMNHLNKKTLIALFDLAQADVPASVQSLATHLGHSRKEVASCLDELGRLGLVRPETVRLTLVGLMKASGLRSRRVSQSAAA